MKDALDGKIAVDAFIILTGNETWFGDTHQYRKRTGIPAKLVVIAMAANQHAVAAPSDSNQLNVVGFNTTVRAVVAGFIRQQAVAHACFPPWAFSPPVQSQ